MLTPGRNAVNSPVRLSVNFQDEDRVDQDPSTVTLKILSPEGVPTSYVYGVDAAVIKTSVGDYYADVTPNTSGRWRYRWETTGTNKTIAIESDFVVQRSSFYEDLEDAYR